MKIGCDLISINRIEKIYQKQGVRFLNKFLSDEEQKLVKSSATLAGFWAAKEAASKALGLGICKECSFFDIKISKNAKNAPCLTYSQKLCQVFKIKSNSLSISHDNGFAMAVVLVLEDNENKL